MPFDAFERMIAVRYLRARRTEGFVSVIAGFCVAGIGLGVATLIVVMAVMNGFRDELVDRILGLNGHVSVVGANGSIPDFDMVTGQLRGVDSVTSAVPVVEGQVLAAVPGTSTFALVRGMREADMAARKALAQAITAGVLADVTGTDTVMVGARMAEALHIGVGDGLTLISPKGTVTAFGTVPRMKVFTVAAIFEVGMYEYDNGFVYVPLEAAQAFFQLPDRVTHIEMTIADPENPEGVARVVQGLLSADFAVGTWMRGNAGFFSALDVQRNVMALILAMIILVAAFNIIAGLIMMVKDKGHDIAILRTMGATRGAVMRVFFMSGASVGILGTALGVVLGLLVALNIENIRRFLEGVTGTELFSAKIYFLTRLPATISISEVLWIAALALGLSFVATLYPAWRAARLDPVEALRYE